MTTCAGLSDSPPDGVAVDGLLTTGVRRPSRLGGRTIATVAGTTTIVVGLALIPLPGPGSLLVVAGLRLLATHHPWAARLYEPARRRAIDAARISVSTWPRVVLSAVGPLWLVVLALAYSGGVSIPEVTVVGMQLGPELPFAGTATTLGLWVSAAVVAVLVMVSAVRWGPLSRPAALRPGDSRPSC